MVRALGAGWLIGALWALLGALLAILSRGTAVPIGLGIAYGLVVEGVISGFEDDPSWKPAVGAIAPTPATWVLLASP